jgi:hypothetical protein
MQVFPLVSCLKRSFRHSQQYLQGIVLRLHMLNMQHLTRETCAFPVMKMADTSANVAEAPARAPQLAAALQAAPFGLHGGAGP